MPVFLMPGNHDDPEEMRRSFPEHAYLRQRTGKVDYAIEDFPVRIVALDSTVHMKPHGGLTSDQLHWLEDTLDQEPAKPTIVALHHPPFPTGIGHMDAQLLKDPAPFADDAPSRFVMEPPAFQLHLWREGLGLATHTAAIGNFAGPYPFHEGGTLID